MVKKDFEVKYMAGDVEVKLTPDIVKNYLVRGKPELISMQEMMFFIGVCRARGLNPFSGDCYILKYTQNDPAAIITSIDFKRAGCCPGRIAKVGKRGLFAKTKTGLSIIQKVCSGMAIN